MSVMSWLIRKGRLLQRGSAEEIASRAEAPRGAFPTPRVVRDQIAPVQSQHDGKTYESRSALYRSYKAGGVRIVEAGEKPAEHRGEPITRDEVQRALAKVRAGYKPDLPPPANDDEAP